MIVTLSLLSAGLMLQFNMKIIIMKKNYFVFQIHFPFLF